MLVLSRFHNERIIIVTSDGPITVTVANIRGTGLKAKVGLGIDAPSHTPVHREEVYKEILRERDAQSASTPSA